MTRSRLALLLILVAAAGCQQSVAVPNRPSDPLPPAQAAPRVTAMKIVSPRDVEVEAPAIPPVSLSKQHAKWCVSQVGDAFPAAELPRLKGQRTKLQSLYGKQATVVLFWQDDRWMSRMALEDLAREVASRPAEQVAVVGVFVGRSNDAAQKVVSQAHAEFPQLVDANGATLAEVGSVALPRVYVLDQAGKIVWFDIEYSEGTRRELAEALAVLTAAE